MQHHLILLALAGQLIGRVSCRSQGFRQLCDRGISLTNLQLSAGSEIFVPGDSGFEDVSLRWTNFSRPTFSAAVQLATACDIPFLATSGAHGFSTTLGKAHRVLEIQLSQFRNVSVDAAASTLTVGGGVRFLDTLDAVYAAGKEINHGTGACVGMVSASLGGGVGRYNGLHGMIGDQLLSARVVIANGSLITTSAIENPDLFWALRGAGNNFGVVVEATYQVYDLTASSIVNADFAFHPNASAAIIDYLVSFGDSTPAKLAVILYGNYDSNTQDLSLWVNIVYAGSKAELQPFLDPLLEKATPYRQNVTEVPWNKMLYANFFGAAPSPEAACSGKGTNRDVYGGALKSYNKHAWNDFIGDFAHFLRSNEDARSSIFFVEQFSKTGVLQIPNSETSYPWRDVTAHLLWNYGWTDPATLPAIERFGTQWRDTLQASSGFTPQEIYVNYAHGDENPEVLYSKAKLPRLRALKQIWDPKNVFGFYNSLV
ncbi:hypothetical protein O1611_g8216 [Lasiodiplodia mahajangana]|uniref:Uncharacterized protein n=1 Tax=Lasiodiplodia mahajangana TaxID=1108764 RepID=A0ACC2JDX7_9PEZI|nr:hypothetical protein O1611_g8216 [Lasiodiplodia mahajangana]